MVHELKILKCFAEKHSEGLKPWELRKNDRDFKVGDLINFTVIDIDGLCCGWYSLEITYLYQGTDYGLKEGYCVMTLGNLQQKGN